MSEMCCTRLAENTGRKNDAKNRHLGTIAQRCRLYILPMPTTIGIEPFTCIDFDDDIALLTEMLSELVLTLEIMNHDAKSLDLQVSLVG